MEIKNRYTGDIIVTVREWQQARNNAPDAEISAVDSKYALAAGLPVLAALHTLAARLERANQYVSAAEVLAELRPVISLAIGEGVKRAAHAGCRLELPGVPSIPTTPLLESMVVPD